MHFITENWEYIRKRKKVSLHLGWRKGYILTDFSFIWSFDVLNCNKQPLSVHWSSNMGCRSIVRLRFNSTLNHCLLSPRKIYLWNHWAVIVKWNLCYEMKWNRLWFTGIIRQLFLPHQSPVVTTNSTIFFPSLSNSFVNNTIRLAKIICSSKGYLRDLTQQFHHKMWPSFQWFSVTYWVETFAYRALLITCLSHFVYKYIHC